MIFAGIEFSAHNPGSLQLNSCPIYYSQPYLKQIETEISSFYAIKKDTQQILIVIHFQVLNNQAISLRNAPFGGIHFEQSIETSVFEAFMNFIVTKLKSKRINEIVIKTAPPCYHNHSRLHWESLNKLGFTNSQDDINHHIEIAQPKITEQLSHMQKRRLEKCKKANFQFRKESPTELKRVYNFIVDCRKEKQQSVSVSLNKLDRLMRLLPDSYLIFCCYDGQRLIAATICVVVNDLVLYNFFPSSKATYNTYSPMVFLISNLYEYCVHYNLKILDLGTSMLDNAPNDKLIAFKNRVGGIATKRSIYSMKL